MDQRLKPIVVEAPQRSEAWFQARLGVLTASKVKDCILSFTDAQRNSIIRSLLNVAKITEKIKGSDAFQELISLSPFELLDRSSDYFTESEKRKKLRQEMVAERITRRRADADKFVTEDMKWGIINEDYAATLYQLQYKMIAQDAPLMLHPELKCGASPDRLVTDPKTGEVGNLEIKCLRSANHLYNFFMTEQAEEDYYPQIQMQMWIDGRDWCDFVGYDSRVPEGLKIFVKRIKYDPGYVANILEPNVRRFLNECDRDEKFFRAKISEVN